MKKLLVLALAVVLTLSLTVVASAATFDPYVGGEFQLNYSTDAYGDEDPTGALENDANGARFKSYVTGKVEDKDSGTWAKIGILFKSWNFPDMYDDDGDTDVEVSTHWTEIYEAGINVNENLTIWYTNDENNDTDRGQVPLKQAWYKFGGDPFFDHGPNDALGIKWTSDTLDAALTYVFPKAGVGTSDETNPIYVAVTSKFDGGKVYLAYYDGYNNDDKVKAPESKTIVGGEYAFGFGTLKADYFMKEVGDADGSVIQVAADLLDSKLNVVVLADDGIYFANDGGIGFGVTYNISDKLYVGGRSITANEDAEEGNNQDNFYLGFKHGVFDTRIGSATEGTGDSIFYIATHVGMW